MVFVKSSSLAFAVLVAGSLAAWPAAAQIPDTFTNLQVLDKDIEKPELVATMRDWASGLGVRCAFCHVGPDNLRGMDFASDEKANKRTARRMIAMARKINRELLADLPTVTEEKRDHAEVVSCYTCHRGLERPPRRTVAELWAAIRVDDSVDAGLTRFDQLAANYADAGQYDLRPAVLDRLARDMIEGGESDDARHVLMANLERHPDSASTWATLAFLEMNGGNLAEARKAVDKALALDPEDFTVTGTAEWLARLEAKAEAEAEKKPE